MGLSDSVIVDFIPGEPAIITLETLPDSIPADGSTYSVVTATVMDGYGNIVKPGTEVLFSTTLGRIDPNRGWTDSLGQVSVQLISANTTGRATLTVTSGSATAFAWVYFTELLAGSINLISDSLSIVASGLTTTRLTAFVLDTEGRPVPDGTPIFFTTTSGILIPTVTYTADAQASVTLRSAVRVDTAKVVASAGGGVSSDTLRIFFRSGPPASIVLNSVPETIPADGESTSTITAYVTDINSNIVSTGTRISFSTTLGTIDTAGWTNNSGNAIVRLTAGVVPGIAQIIANSGTAIGNTTVSMTNTEAAHAFVSVTPTSLVANNVSTSAVTGLVTTSAGTPVSSGTPVFNVLSDALYGTVIPLTVRTDTLGAFQQPSGQVAPQVTHISSPMPAERRLTQQNNTLLPGEPDSIYLASDSLILRADSVSSTVIRAVLFDSFGNRLRSGRTVTFESSLGAITPSSVTNSSGMAVATLRTGRTSGICRVTAISGSARAEIDVTFNNTTASMVIVDVDDDHSRRRKF
jgi:adhesin/invasin